MTKSVKGMQILTAGNWEKETTNFFINNKKIKREDREKEVSMYPCIHATRLVLN